MEQPLSGFLTSSERKLLFAEHKRETDGRIRDRYKLLNNLNLLTEYSSISLLALFNIKNCKLPFFPLF